MYVSCGYGDLSACRGGADCVSLYDHLINTAVYGPTGGAIAILGWRGPYMEFKGEDLMGSVASTEIKDPWRKSYKYEMSGTKNTQSFDLWSLRSDGENDKDTAGVDPDDDITNW